MPTAPLHPCPIPGCPQLQPCTIHRREKERQRTKTEPWRKWYHLARWRHPIAGLRAQVLSADPLCQACKQFGRVELATEVDHIVPHKGDPVKFWALSNLAGLCSACHSAKTRRGE